MVWPFTPSGSVPAPQPPKHRLFFTGPVPGADGVEHFVRVGVLSTGKLVVECRGVDNFGGFVWREIDAVGLRESRSVYDVYPHYEFSSLFERAVIAALVHVSPGEP
jgi:hypothetical protein